VQNALLDQQLKDARHEIQTLRDRVGELKEVRSECGDNDGGDVDAEEKEEDDEEDY